MVDYIDQKKAEFGVEPICKVLLIALSTYYAYKNKTPSKRELRDQDLKPEIMRVWEESKCRYGANKVYKQLLREGFGVARCTVGAFHEKTGNTRDSSGSFQGDY